MIICVIDLKLLSLMVPLLSNLMFSLVLAQSLALFYLNGLSSVPLLSSTKLTMYADDILLSHPFDSLSDLPLIQSNIDLISSSHYLIINSSKTKYRFISLKSPSCFSSFFSLYLNDSPLELVSSYKYIGVLLSSNLSWSFQIRQICSKCRKPANWLSFPLLLSFRYNYYVSKKTAYFIIAV